MGSTCHVQREGSEESRVRDRERAEERNNGRHREEKRNTPSWTIHNVFHVDLLAPYTETDAHGPNFICPPPELIEGKPKWEVERIIDSRRFGKKCKLQYLIKWKDYPHADNTWEDATDVHALDLVNEFTQRTQMPTVHRSDAQLKKGVISPGDGCPHLLSLSLSR